MATGNGNLKWIMGVAGSLIVIIVSGLGVYWTDGTQKANANCPKIAAIEERNKIRDAEEKEAAKAFAEADKERALMKKDISAILYYMEKWADRQGIRPPPQEH
jgi:hypothetical protein